MVVVVVALLAMVTLAVKAATLACYCLAARTTKRAQMFGLKVNTCFFF